MYSTTPSIPSTTTSPMIIDDPTTPDSMIVVGYCFGPKKMKTMASVMIQTAEATSRQPTWDKGGNSAGCDVSIISADSKHQQEQDQEYLHLHHFPPHSVSTSEDALSDTHSVQSSSCSSSSGYTSSLGSSSVSIMDVTPSSPSLHNSAATEGITKVKFVPLNLDLPLESQHGGRFDCILHKLTEDLLTVTNSSSDQASNLSHSRSRLARLTKYCAFSPSCNLIDPLPNVSLLMSRASIASILEESLGKIEGEGIFRAPKHAVINNEKDREEFLSSTPHALTYPLIAKPLDAAGTAESHKMTVVLNPSGLADVMLPCLLQAYENHGGVLFKVYVLGDYVRVFPRPSLPNLPEGADFERRSLDFDSQKPYPTIREFKVVGSEPSPSTPAPRVGPVHLTVPEVLPIADDIRRTFGLDLFGFDVLVRESGASTTPSTKKDDGINAKELVVVDVNYFPSYKELYKDFPSMLAEFLIGKALEKKEKKDKKTC
mmetsp:Transcript_16917/g.34811  ORF Transcript_16917/g.34811 Transcript_16917/m.34811 type:complete len:486 (-) Transcript_16917:91-1548(-)